MRKTVIEPNGKNFQYWKDIWNYRELAYNFAKRDITVRYKQTRIGLGWAVIAPIVNMFVSTFIFGTLANLPSDGSAPYAVMVYAGGIIWSIFSANFSSSANTFIVNATIMKKVYFPRILSAIGTALSKCFDSLISTVVLIILMLVYKYYPTPRFLLFPVFMIMGTILGMAIGLFVSAFNIKWRDLAQIIPFLISIGIYLCPVNYSFDAIPEKWQLLYSCNPVTGIVLAFKWCVISDLEFNWTAFLISIAWIAVLVPLGIHNFRKAERTFVDIV